MSDTTKNNCRGKCSNCKPKKEKGLPLITSGFMILTERCNLACRYCFVNQNPREMTFEIAMDAVNFLIRNAEKSGVEPGINFFGGEPLLKWKEIIVPITQYIREEYKKPFRIGMTTNGVLLDAEKIAFMKKNKIGALFSIDGDKKTQDFNRPFHNGKGSFNAIEKAIDLILEYEPNATFRATIDHRTVQHTYENIRFADKKGYNNMFFIPNVFATWNETQKQILKEQIGLFGDWFIEEARKGRIINFSPFCEKIGQIIKINDADFKNTFRKSVNQPGEGKCGLGATRFGSIGTDGTIFGCQEMTSNTDTNAIFNIGNIYDGVNEEARLNLINHFNKQKVNGLNCDECLLNAICDGGCVANNYMLTGDMNRMPDILCYWYQILLDEAIRVSRILGEERNKVFKHRFFTKNNQKGGRKK